MNILTGVLVKCMDSETGTAAVFLSVSRPLQTGRGEFAQEGVGGFQKGDGVDFSVLAFVGE